MQEHVAGIVRPVARIAAAHLVAAVADIVIVRAGCGSASEFHPVDFDLTCIIIAVTRIAPSGIVVEYRSSCRRIDYASRETLRQFTIGSCNHLALFSRGPGAVEPPSSASARPKLLDQVRNAIRARHYSRRTEVAYVTWIRRYIDFHQKAHPSTLAAPDISAFLTWLATKQHVSASTENQALAALLFLYEQVLHLPVGPVEHVARAKTPIRLPVVLSRQEVASVLVHLDGSMWIIGVLLYGAGLRLEECLTLRVKDIDFDRNQITVRRGKGQKDRVTMLPGTAAARLRVHLEQVRRLHAADLKQGHGRVVLPDALERKYPNAATEWGWQFLFPASRVCRDRRWGPPSRFHLHESAVQKAVAAAVRQSGIAKRVGPHTLRRSRMKPALGSS